MGCCSLLKALLLEYGVFGVKEINHSEFLQTVHSVHGSM